MAARTRHTAAPENRSSCNTNKRSLPPAQASAPVKHWRETPLRERLNHIVDSDFARVTYTEAIEIVAQAQASGKVSFEESNIVWGMDMGSEHERYLCERHFMRPTIVTNYPAGIKAFYMRLDDDGKVSACGWVVGAHTRQTHSDAHARTNAFI